MSSLGVAAQEHFEAGQQGMVGKGTGLRTVEYRRLVAARGAQDFRRNL